MRFLFDDVSFLLSNIRARTIFFFFPLSGSTYYTLSFLYFPALFHPHFSLFFPLSLPPPPPPTHTPCYLAQFLAPRLLRSKSFPPTHKLFISLQAGIYGRNTLSGGDCGSAILIYALSLSCREAAISFYPQPASLYLFLKLSPS